MDNISFSNWQWLISGGGGGGGGGGLMFAMQMQ